MLVMESHEIMPSAFDLDEHGDTAFERMSKTNGTRYWYARDLMRALGYDNWAAFRNIMNKAIGVCTSVGIIVTENFIQDGREIDGKYMDDFKLSRLACCLTAMNGDSKKPEIAIAQIYFAALDAVVSGNPIKAENVDRIAIREQISDREVTLSGAAKDAGVKYYGRFQDAGYRGMYNMDYDSLKRLKGLPDMKRSLLDFMQKEELAGNLFRLTLTEGRIKRDGAKGQFALEYVAEQVGRTVRDTMIEQTGVRPEEIPIGPDIKEVRKSIKGARKTFLRGSTIFQRNANMRQRNNSVSQP